VPIFKFFALTRGGNVLGGEANCSGGECLGEYVPVEMCRGMSYIRSDEANILRPFHGVAIYNVI